MYKTLTGIAQMFDVSVGYIKKHHAEELEEGKHFIYVGDMKRYDVGEMRKLLVRQTVPDRKTNAVLDRFLI